MSHPRYTTPYINFDFNYAVKDLFDEDQPFHSTISVTSGIIQGRSSSNQHPIFGQANVASIFLIDQPWQQWLLEENMVQTCGPNWSLVRSEEMVAAFPSPTHYPLDLEGTSTA